MSKRALASIAATTLGVLLLGLLGVAALAMVKPDGRQEIVVDHAVVDEWEQTLAPGLADLSSIDDPAGLEGDGPAQIRPCSIDSGELLDLSAGRTWTARVPGRSPEGVHPSVSPDTAQGFRAIIRRLTTAGWVVMGREHDLGMDLPTGLTFDTVRLKKLSIERTTQFVTVQVLDDGVDASLGYEGASKACHLAT